MKPVNGYEEAKAMGEGQERLPVDGYVIKILDAKTQDYAWGSVLLLSFDIAEGEYKDFYANNYKAQTQEEKKWKGVHRMNVPKDNSDCRTEDEKEKNGWTMSAFKRDILAIEDSNSGFHWDWDEQKLKGLTVGAVMQDREYSYNGSEGFWTACHHLTSVDRIRDKTFRIPKPKLLDREKEARKDFQPSDIPDDDLPF